MAAIRVKRGTRAQLDSAAASSGLAAGEPYLITDEARPAIGTGVDAYVTAVTGNTRITVGTTAPASPSVGDIWVDTN